jgi:hypothetical protein
MKRATDSPNCQGNVSSIEGAVFSANLRRIIMLDESAPHTHVITNLRLSNVSSNENGTMTITGSSTVSMPEGPIVDAPTAIMISGEAISVFPNPSSVNGHFGETPTYRQTSIGYEKDHSGSAYFTFLGPTGDASNGPTGNTINSVPGILDF